MCVTRHMVVLVEEEEEEEERIRLHWVLPAVLDLQLYALRSSLTHHPLESRV